MNDVFKEQLIKKIPSTKEIFFRALIVSTTLVLVLASFIIFSGQMSILAPVAAAGLIFAAYYLLGRFNLEYEYIYTNGELDIDVIYARARRKRLITVNVRDFELMAHIEDKAHEHDFDKAEAVKDYSSGKVSDNTYAFLYTHKGKRTKFIIEPNDTLLKAMSTALTKRKLFINPRVSGGI